MRTATSIRQDSVLAYGQEEGINTLDPARIGKLFDFDWKRGDVMAAPAWRPHFHESSDDAILLRVTDEPVMKQLGFFRTEAQ